MSILPEGFDIIKGFTAFILGGLLVISIGVIQAVRPEAGIGDSTVITILTVVGLLVMILWPLWYWVGRPIYVWFQNIGGDSS